MSAAEDLGEYLDAENLVGTDAWFVNWMPEAPDAVVVLTDTSGPPPDHVMGGASAPAMLSFGVQVRVRDSKTGGESARDLAFALWEATLVLVDIDLNGVHYHQVVATGSPAYIGRDANDRPSYTFNLILER